ncbi:MAG TPA: VWA domain-containing protein [Tepidisphaeraceae bacterium]|jgi:uncharacterized protein YegL|nr:VWA domain-containing protein [Tepidisphaeraceae bacterium]
MPSFLNIFPAAIAAAIAIPALIILYFLKLRRREMAVSSTLLWKKAIQDLQVNSPFQKLKRNLLLLLQLLLLIALLLALSRPVTHLARSAGKMTVILVDRSASMSAKDINNGRSTRLDEAKRRAKDLVSSLDRGDYAMIIAFDDSAETLHPFTTDAQALRSAIDSIQPTDRPTKLKLAYQLAEAQSNFNPEQLRVVQKPTVWLFSDGNASDAKDLELRAELKYDPIGSSTSSNVGVVALSAKRNYETPTQVQVFARLADFGPTPVKAQVQLSIAPIDPANPSKLDFQVMRIADTQLLPEHWSEQDRQTAEKDQGLSARDSVEFNVDLTTAAVIKVEQMRKEGDALAADDVATVVVPPPKNLRVLLVTDGDYFLEKAINSLSLKDPITIDPLAYEASFDHTDDSNPAKFDVIVFDRYKPQKLPVSGAFMYFGTVPDHLKLKAVMDGDHFATIKGSEVLDWRRSHPLLRHLSLAKVEVAELIKLNVPLEDEVLVDGTAGPLMVLHREGRQIHLVVAFDLLQSNWPLRVSFPVFMQNAMQFLAVGSEMGVRESYSPGSTPRIPRMNIDRVDPNLKQVRLDKPNGTTLLTIPQTGDFALPPLDQVGVYTTTPAIPQYEQIAVNLLDANESDLTPATSPPGGVGESLAQAGGKSRLELWWWLIACGALPLLLIEWIVYTRRVHV